MFFEAVTSFNNEKFRNHAEGCQRKIEKKEEFVRNLESMVYDLYGKIDCLDYDSRYYEENKSKYESKIDTNEEKIREVRDEVHELVEKRVEFLNKIK